MKNGFLEMFDFNFLLKDEKVANDFLLWKSS